MRTDELELVATGSSALDEAEVRFAHHGRGRKRPDRAAIHQAAVFLRHGGDSKLHCLDKSPAVIEQRDQSDFSGTVDGYLECRLVRGGLGRRPITIDREKLMHGLNVRVTWMQTVQFDPQLSAVLSAAEDNVQLPLLERLCVGVLVEREAQRVRPPVAGRNSSRVAVER